MRVATISQPMSDPSMTIGARAALLACGLFTTIGLFSVGLLLPQIGIAYSATPGAALLTQVIGAVSSFCFAVGAPFAGTLIDRLGCRRVLTPSLCVFAVAGAAPALVDSLWAIIALRAILGVALAGIFTAGLTGIGALPDRVRARMFGWFSVVGGAAAIVMFPLIGMLAAHGWRLPFLVNLIALPIVPLAMLLPRDLGRAGRSTPADGVAAGRLLDGPMLILFVLAGFVGMAMFIGPMYSPLYFASLGVTDTRLMAVPITLASIAAVLASASYGLLHRKFGVSGVSILTLLLIAGALLLSGTASSIPIFTVGIILAGAGVAAFAPNVSAAAVELSAGRNPARALGTANGVMFGSQLLFPFIADAVMRAAGLAAVFVAFGGCSLLLGAALWLKHALSR